MIARIWRGIVQLNDADVYADHIRETGFAEYAQTSGNRGAWLLRRDQGDRSEFITLSLWDSVDAIRAFAGDDIDAAVLYPEDARYLVDGHAPPGRRSGRGPVRVRREAVASDLGAPGRTRRCRRAKWNPASTRYCSW